VTILYNYGNSLYINITNKCPCDCVFCIRNNGEGINKGQSLWLENEPTIEEIKKEIDKSNILNYDEIVFCGYGEPTERLDAIIEISQYLKEKTNIQIRVNTNGLSDLINNKPTAPLLSPYIDSISISMNAPTKEEYNILCKPSFGEKSFQAMLDFGVECSKYIKNTVFTIVDVLDKDKKEACKKICEDLGVTLRIREIL
jgi:radical SAM enzyme (TIGR04100 family)